jgi:twitching motility protein PilT
VQNKANREAHHERPDAPDPSQLQTGKESGMQLMDQALLDAIQRREIDPDDAYRFATDKRQFSRFVTDTGMLPKMDLAE